jgi:hypothetical protein
VQRHVLQPVQRLSIAGRAVEEYVDLVVADEELVDEGAVGERGDGVAELFGTSLARSYTACAAVNSAGSSAPEMSTLTLRVPASLLVMIEPRVAKARMPGSWRKRAVSASTSASI